MSFRLVPGIAYPHSKSLVLMAEAAYHHCNTHHRPRKYYSRITFSSQAYFGFLLRLRWKDWLHPSIARVATIGSSLEKEDGDISEKNWMCSLLCGLATSADTGNEDLVMSARNALVEFCNESTGNLDKVGTALKRNLKAFTAAAASTGAAASEKLSSPSTIQTSSDNRTLIPTLEVLSFLLRTSVLTRSANLDFLGLCTLVQHACYKSRNIRKIEACVRLYGEIAGQLGRPPLCCSSGVDEGTLVEAVAEAKKCLAALLYHPWPRIRSLVVDQLWAIFELAQRSRDKHEAAGGATGAKLLGIDWGSAGKASIRRLIHDLGLAEL